MSGLPPEMPSLASLVLKLADALLARRWYCATAESCTGGLLGAALTAVPGSSRWYRGGVVAYDNSVKESLLGVPADDLARFGAVSEEVARHMALGALERLGADAALSVTGVAGPDGGSAEKPVGTVWLGWAVRHVDGQPGAPAVWAERRLFSGDRENIRSAAVAEALRGLLFHLTAKG